MARDITALSRMMNTENKHHDTIAAPQTVNNTTSLVYGIGTLTQGITNTERIGDSVKFDRIDLSLRFFQYSTTTPVDSNYRYFVIRYLKTPATSGTTAFAISEFLNIDSAGDYSSMSLPDTDTNENFQILSQGDVHITGCPSTYGYATDLVSLSIPVNFHQYYSGAANTTITDNMCFVVLVSDSSPTVSQVSISARMWYVDN